MRFLRFLFLKTLLNGGKNKREYDDDRYGEYDDEEDYDEDFDDLQPQIDREIAKTIRKCDRIEIKILPLHHKNISLKKRPLKYFIGEEGQPTYQVLKNDSVSILMVV